MYNDDCELMLIILDKVVLPNIRTISLKLEDSSVAYLKWVLMRSHKYTFLEKFEKQSYNCHGKYVNKNNSIRKTTDILLISVWRRTL